jgi:hypothetical protein
MRRLCILLAVGQFTVIQAFAGVDVFAELGRSAAAKKEDGAPKAAGDAAAKGGGQEKALSITVRNSSNKPESNLTVRYWYFGRDMKTMKGGPTWSALSRRKPRNWWWPSFSRPGQGRIRFSR